MSPTPLPSSALRPEAPVFVPCVVVPFADDDSAQPRQRPPKQNSRGHGNSSSRRRRYHDHNRPSHRRPLPPPPSQTNERANPSGADEAIQEESSPLPTPAGRGGGRVGETQARRQSKHKHKNRRQQEAISQRRDRRHPRSRSTRQPAPPSGVFTLAPSDDDHHRYQEQSNHHGECEHHYAEEILNRPDDHLPKDPFPSLTPSPHPPHPESSPLPTPLQGAWAAHTIDDSNVLRSSSSAQPSTTRIWTNADEEAHNPSNGQLRKALLARGHNLTLLPKPARSRRPSDPVASSSSTPTSSRSSPLPDHEEATTEMTLQQQQQKIRWEPEKWTHRLWDLMNQHQSATSSGDTDGCEGKSDGTSGNQDDASEAYLPPVELPSSTMTADAIVDEVYINDAFPLHAAIRRGDYDALRALLHTGDLAKLFLQDEVSGMDPFQLAVHRDNAIMLQMLVRAVPARTVTQDDVRSASRRPPAPCLAAREGKMECLSVFLDASATNLLARDTAGNSVMHLVCRRKIRASALSLCFDCLRRDASTSFITKVICSRNEAGQTPVHIASSGGRTDLVELFLGFGSLSLLSKVLSIQDNKRQTPLLAAVASASTDTVMSLLMWSGNNNLVMQKAETTLPSPLLWAACAFQVDMVDLLLGFFHSTGNKQGLDATLRQVVELECLPTNRQAKSKIIARLTRAGANPCTLHNDKLSTMEIATNLRDRETLTVLIDSHKAYLQKLQTSRRRDPVLKKQPKSYFDGLEQVENGSLRAALRNSLLVCLINILKHGNKEPGSVMESCAILLYEKGATVNPDGFEMIKTAVCRTSFWLPCDGSQEEIAFAPFGHPPCPVPARNHVRHPYIQNGEESRFLWSSVAKQAAWFTHTECDHFESLLYEMDIDSYPFDAHLESNNGDIFEAHTELLVKKSAKFDAAYRFHKIQYAGDDVATPIKFSVPASAQLCHLLLQHMYHGSLIDLPRNPADCCNVLLDLVALAEQLLCESLLQECEIRLLSENPREVRSCIHDGADTLSSSQFQSKILGPTQLITPDSALDVLAAVDNVNFEASYRLLSRRRQNSARSFQHRPLEKVRSVVTLTCLRSMGSVFNSGPFQAQVELCTGDAEGLKLLLLRYCLDVFSSQLILEPVHESFENVCAKSKWLDAVDSGDLSVPLRGKA